MTQIGPVRAGSGGTDDGEMARLRAVSRQMEGVFMQQLFKAMRETVPTDGSLSGGAGEEVFTGLLDQHLADAASAGSSRGPGEALFRQLRAAYAGQGAGR